MAGMGKFLKQAQKMQTDMARIQEEIKNTTLEATSGGGVVKVIMRGDKKIDSIEIDSSFFEDPDPEMLQDLIVAAVNQACDEVDEYSQEKLGKITQGMQIPGLSL